MNIRKIAIVTFATVILLGTLVSGTYAAGNVSLMFGNKSLDKDDWEPTDSQTELGLGFELQKPEWPAAVVVSYLSAEDSATVTDVGLDLKLTLKTTELGVGARKYLTKDSARFFVEGGLASISADTKVGVLGISVSFSDSAIGFWVGTGVDIPVADALSLGLLARISRASVSPGGIGNVEAGGTHLGAFVAYHFGK